MTDKSATIKVDGSKWLGELSHNWNYIGYDEINYTYTPESQELLAKFMQFQEKPYYIRAHHLLCNGNCHGFYKWGSTNVYSEDSHGNPIYFWTYVDLVFDTILKFNCKPFVELGFMPKDLVSPEHLARIPQQAGWHADYLMYQSHGWTCPPKDYQKWYDLIYALLKHCLDRYGLDEIKSWYWELWNEPDIRYWAGTIEEFNKLYDYTAAAVKAACPDARVGGPSVTNPDLNRNSGKYLDIFLDHCHNGKNYLTGQVGTPLDFITFHVKGGGYPMDLKASKSTPPSVKRILRDVKTGYEIISKYSNYKDLECILSEIDPDGWAAGGVMDNINFEFRNTEYYPSFVAASFDKVNKFAKSNNWDLRLLSWAYLFVGERCFEGTRSFSTQGIDKAILNLFRMYAKTGVKQISMESTEEKDPLTYSDMIGYGVSPDIAGFASFTPGKSIEILLYNHHDDWDLNETWTVNVELVNLPFDATQYQVAHYRIDATHSNAYPEWLRQGKPLYPEAGQKAAIKARESLELLEPEKIVVMRDGKLKLSFTMPVHGVSLLIFSPIMENI